MTMHLDEKLSALLDGELAGEERASAEAHLAACAECRAALAGLRAVTERAAALPDAPPARDLWAGIQARLGEAPVVSISDAPSRRRRFAFSVPQLAAAAIALMALSAGAVTLLLGRGPAVPAGYAVLRLPADTGMAVTTVSLEKTPAGMGIESYDAAIAEIEAVLKDRRTVLDTATVRVLEQSLMLIDAAVRQAREALARDPNNAYLSTHLQGALDRKLELLRQVAELPRVS